MNGPMGMGWGTGAAVLSSAVMGIGAIAGACVASGAGIGACSAAHHYLQYMIGGSVLRISPLKGLLYNPCLGCGCQCPSTGPQAVV